MREPRSNQRLPEGGLDIYEKQKAGQWKYCAELLMAYPSDWKHPRGIHHCPLDEMIRWGYVLRINPHFDPMLYFWPVDGFQLIAFAANLDSDHSQRLVRAALRDGASIVVLNNMTRLSSLTRWYDQESGYKTPAFEQHHEITEKELLRQHCR